MNAWTDKRVRYAANLCVNRTDLKELLGGLMGEAKGPFLGASGTPLGAVLGALGLKWFDITVTGTDAHAGATPMPYRQDALLAAARLTEALHAIAPAHDRYARATVGVIRALPGSRNVVAGRIFMTADLRAWEQETLQSM